MGGTKRREKTTGMHFNWHGKQKSGDGRGGGRGKSTANVAIVLAGGAAGGFLKGRRLVP